MDPLKNTNYRLAARSLLSLPVLIIGLQMFVALLTYPFLPANTPSHWNAAGQIDGYMPKLINAILMPAISIAVYVLRWVVPAAGPKLGNENQQAALDFTLRLLPAVFLLLLGLQLSIVAASFGIALNIEFIAPLLVSLLYIYMGNFMGKLRRNFWAGIRTPWALANDAVWERTHRLGGWLFVAVGLLGVLVSLMPAFAAMRISLVVGGMLLNVVILYIYSYLVYRRVMEYGEGTRSPPFDNPG